MKVSILIPNYNHAKYLGEAIASAQAQTYADIEILISDNCSSDHSREIIQDIATRDSRIKYFFQKENIGPIANWKFLLNQVTGRYFLLLFSDDRLHKEFVERGVNALDKSDCGFFLSTVKTFGYESKVIHQPNFEGYFSSRIMLEGLLFYKGSFPVSPGCSMFRSSDIWEIFVENICNRYGLNVTKSGYGTDLMMYLKCLQKYKFYFHASTPLAFFRGHEDSISFKKRIIENKTAEHYYNYLITKANFVEQFMDLKQKRRFNSVLLLFGLIYGRKLPWYNGIRSVYISNEDAAFSIIELVRLAFRLFLRDRPK